MVYINSWQKYQEAAENLYAKSPRKVWYHPLRLFLANDLNDLSGWLTGCGKKKKTRYSVKWRSSEGKLVLKITDDETVRIHLPTAKLRNHRVELKN